MAYNAIQAALMVRSWSQDMTTGEITEGYALSEDANSDTLLETRFNAVMEYGYITGVDYNEDRDEYTYDLSDDAFNGGAITTDVVSVEHLTTDLDVSSLYGQKVKVIYQDNSAHDVYGIYPYESSVLTSADTGIDFDDVTVYDGIARDDYVKIVAGANTVDGKDAYTLIEDVVEGEIDALRTSELRVDGTWYSFDEANFTSYDVGDSYTFVIVNGYICANDALTTGADLSDYALVVNAVASGSNGMLGDQARLMFTDGSTEIVDTDISYVGNIGDLVTYEIEDGEYVLTPRLQRRG